MASVTELVASLDRLVPEVLRITGTPGLSVAVSRGDETVVRAYGWADVAARRPMSAACAFPAGSMTKLYTAIAVLQLVERGVVGLHDAVNRHLGDVECTNPLGAREITIYDLLTFTSGLAVDTTACRLSEPPPLAEHVRRGCAAAHGQEYEGRVPRWTARVGDRYQYANLGVSTLGLLVERRNPEGLDLAQYVRRHILEPLRMERTVLSDWRGAPPRDVASGYACFDGVRVPTPWLRSADWPANGLITRPQEHVRLLRALLDGGDGILEPATIERMTTPQVPLDEVWPGGWWCGLAVVLTGRDGPEAHFGHPGAHMWGWWSVGRAYPQLDLAVVACANGWDMMRWHNPANPDAAATVADHVAAFARGGAGAAASTWAAERSRAVGSILAERTYGLLGVPERLPDEELRAMAARTSAAGGWDADAFLDGARDGAAGAPAPAMLLDLGAAYGFPVPLSLWPSMRSTAAAIST